MKKRLRVRSHLLALLAFFWCAPGFAAVWGVPSDVTDDDLILNGGAPIVLPAGGTTIFADTQDITITVVNNDATIEGAPEDPSQLYLCTSADRTITFDLTDGFDLTFLGSQDGTPLLISAGGEGKVDFLLSGGRKLSFGLCDGKDMVKYEQSNNGPVQFYLFMEGSDEYTPCPTVRFKRQDVLPDQNEEHVTVLIGSDSCISYLSSETSVDGYEKGCIEFHPANDGAGRMALDICDCGSFIIAGHFAEAEKNTVTLEAIERETAAGNNAITSVFKDPDCFDEFDEYGNPHACLLVINRNTKCSDLLIDPFCNLGAKHDYQDYNGDFDGVRYGFVLGANATFQVGDGACLDYVGLANNVCCDIESIPGVFEPTDDCLEGDYLAKQFLKFRNGSAFIVDGNHNPASTPAKIELGEQSGIYFRSGIDSLGEFYDDLSDACVFTIDPLFKTSCAGEVVFAVEGALNVCGSDTATTLNSRLEILSLQVALGGPLFPGVGDSTMFNKRMFALDDCDELKVYNKAAWLINNRVNLFNTSLAHTDENHLVCPNNDTRTEATYIGGEAARLNQIKNENQEERECDEEPEYVVEKPIIAFYNSRLHVHADVAFTGLDLRVPNWVIDSICAPNLSKFIFYSNGKCVDDGTGRQMILGTLVGSRACDKCTIICKDAHLDIFQDADCADSIIPNPEAGHCLHLEAGLNDMMLNVAIGEKDITGQRSIHTVYLGNNSNISIGTDADNIEFQEATLPKLKIAGNFFSFETNGGILGIPETSSVTGQGGIFVDLNGTFTICPDHRASMGTMITKSRNGLVELPKPQVFFDNRIGVTDWQLTLGTPETVLVNLDECYSDYTLNWMSSTKDFDNFCPYEIGDVTICNCPVVEQKHIASLPTIRGEVVQLQIADSRIGDAVHVKVDFGHVREMLWLNCGRSAEAPVAVVVLENDAQFGVNTAHRNPDSIFTQTTLGVNGISFIANGNGRIDLNEDVIVNNICAFLKGPDWDGDNVLEFHADAPRVIRVTSDGVLDFRSFDNGGFIRFCENVRLVMEPGSRLILGSADLEFTENSQLEFESTPKAGLLFEELDTTLGSIDNSIDPTNSVDAMSDRHQYSPITGYGDGLRNTDPFRIRIMGEGTILFTDQAVVNLEADAFVGVETLSEQLEDGTLCQVTTTDVTIELQESARFLNGHGNNVAGGVLQVGNVEDFEGHSVSFTLKLNGNDTEFVMGAGAFVGFGAGAVRACQSVQTNVFADTMFNVDTVTLEFDNGNFQIDRIFNSDDTKSQSFVLGDVETFNLTYEESGEEADTTTEARITNFAVHGGGNFFLLKSGEGFNDGAMALINREDDGVIVAEVLGSDSVTITRLCSGILGSTPILNNVTLAGVTPSDLFEELKVLESVLGINRSTGRGVSAPFGENFRDARTQNRVGYVDRGLIGRENVSDVIDFNSNGPGGTPEDRRSRANDNGATFIQVNTEDEAPGNLFFATQIQ